MSDPITYRDQIRDAIYIGYREVLINYPRDPLGDKWKNLCDIYNELKADNWLDSVVENPPRSSHGWVAIGSRLYRARKRIPTEKKKEVR